MFRRPRFIRRQTVPLQFHTSPCSAWFGDPANPIVITDFGDAAQLALSVLDLPFTRDALVLLDEHRQVTTILLDPPGELTAFVGWIDGPGLEVPFCQTLLIRRAAVREAPPTKAWSRAYQRLRAAHMLQGLLLLDVIMADAERLQSLAIACDSDPVWFDPVTPAA